ncbi:hypothetical protein ACSBR2_019858 [Camellia fascicularis]
MANNGKEEKIGDDIHSECEEHVDPNVRKEDRNEGVQELNLGVNDASKGRDGPKKGGRDEYYNEGDLQVWKDRCLRKDKEMKEMENSWPTFSRWSTL